MSEVAQRSGTPPRRTSRRLGSTDVFCLILLAGVLVKLIFSSLISTPVVSAWSTIFTAICIQATPFLALGIAVSTAIAVFVPPAFFERALPRRPLLAVPVAAAAGVALPGCECASVPVAASLMNRGVAAAPAVAFLLSAPATNPVVLVATAVAFPGRPEMVLARLVASLVVSTVVGSLWLRLGRDVPRPRRRPHLETGSRAQRARATATYDLSQSLGLLVVGAAAAATLNSVVPRGVLDALSHHWLVGVLTLSVLAVLLAVCSEADAFVASSLTQFSASAQLAFMVIGPTVDVKLIAMQVGTFGRGFALRLVPLTFLCGLLTAAICGAALL